MNEDIMGVTMIILFLFGLWFVLSWFRDKVRLHKIQRVNHYEAYKKRKDPNYALFRHLVDKGCTNCGCKTFAEGPSAGMSQNIECNDCGKKYNFAPFLEWAEEL